MIWKLSGRRDIPQDISASMSRKSGGYFQEISLFPNDDERSTGGQVFISQYSTKFVRSDAGTGRSPHLYSLDLPSAPHQIENIIYAESPFHFVDTRMQTVAGNTQKFGPR